MNGDNDSSHRLFKDVKLQKDTAYRLLIESYQSLNPTCHPNQRTRGNSLDSPG